MKIKVKKYKIKAKFHSVVVALSEAFTFIRPMTQNHHGFFMIHDTPTMSIFIFILFLKAKA